MDTTRAEFFAALFPDSKTFIHLKVLTIVDGKVLPTGNYLYATPDEHEAIEEFIAQHADRELYFGVASRRNVEQIVAKHEAGEGTGDAREGDCDKFYALCADIDFKNVPREDCDKLFANMPVSPDIVVMSGGGYHAYWLLAEPVDAREAYTLLTRVQAYVKSDKVADAPRILRVPGTMNHKPGRGPVEIVKFETTRHQLAEFLFLPAGADEVAPSKRAHVVVDAEECPGADLVMKAFADREMLGDELAEGKIAVTCPWASTHGSEDHPAKTVLYVNDESGPGFNCFSAGCAAANGGRRRRIGDVYQEFGLSLAVKTVQVEAKVEKEEDLGGERYSDMANARLLGDAANERVAHADEMREKFYIYNGAKLELRSKSAVVPFSEPVVQQLYAQAILGETLKKEKEQLLNTGNLSQSAAEALQKEIDALGEQVKLRRAGAARFESRDGVYAAIELLKARPNIHVEVAQLDSHPTWLNVQNGTLDLETGEFWEHRFADLLTKVAGTVYDPTAVYPRWEAFLEDVLPDPDVRSFVQRSVGLALTDVTKDQCLWIFYGTGRNGKSTLIGAIRVVLGDYAANTAATTLMVKAHGDDKRNDIAVLKGTRFVSVSEAEDGHQLAESLVKDITGGDPLTARMMYAEFFTFVPTFKVFIAANHRPRIKGQDLGIWRRINLIPFTVTIPKERVDPDLPAILAAEAPGILNWAIQGYRDWRAGGLRPPKAVEAATEEYKRDSDVLGEFLEDRFEVAAPGVVTAAELWQAYQTWTTEAGIKFTMTRKALGQAMEARGFSKGVVGVKNTRVWRGLRLRTL